jgi:hypothetical protein
VKWSQPAPNEADGIYFRLFGFPVRVRWGFFVAVVALAWLGGVPTLREVAAWVVVAFGSVLWHELGHAFGASVFGASSQIELGAMGGLTRSAALRDSRWWKEVAVSLAGPGAGFVLGGLIWWMSPGALGDGGGAAHTILRMAWWANVGWGLLNLVPILPYDGGLALQAGLVALSPKRGELWANVVSVVVGTAACGVALTMRMLWVAYLAGVGAVQSYREAVRIRLDERTTAGWEALRAGRASEAAEQADVVRRRALDDLTRGGGVELSTWIALHAGDPAAARQAVASLPEGYRPSRISLAIIEALEGKDPAGLLSEVDERLLTVALPPLVASWIGNDAERRAGLLVTEAAAAVIKPPVLNHIAARLFYGSERRAAMLVSTRAFGAHHVPIDAYNVACCLSRLGQPEEGLVWLERAVEAGYTNAAFLAADEDLAAVKALPGFAALAAKLAAAGEVPQGSPPETPGPTSG